MIRRVWSLHNKRSRYKPGGSRRPSLLHRLAQRMRRRPSTRLMIAGWAALLACTSIVVPGLLVRGGDAPVVPLRISSVQQQPSAAPPAAERAQPAPEQLNITVPVYLSRQDKIAQIPLEDYVSGVVAAEMPAEFHIEALKAQAIAARTYIVRRLLLRDDSQVPVQGAIVTDTVQHQAFMTNEQMKKAWGAFAYNEKIDRIHQAVTETAGQIITYKDEPIQAAFFSTSNGYTENSEEYWANNIPYLRSVPSPWDKKVSPKYKLQTTVPAKTVLAKLGLKTNANPATALRMTILEYTSGKRIKLARISGKTYTGRELREKLGLRSAQFTMALKGKNVIFTTYGYGHGVGMSQYGADALADQGKTAQQIIQYYYKGVKIDRLEANQVEQAALDLSGDRLGS